MSPHALPPPAPGWDCHVHVFDAAAPVVAGHYQPVHRPLAEIQALAQGAGFGHLVLVQPSVYGIDNSVLLAALSDSPGRHRGVAVADPQITDAELAHMHALGVRGLRFNLVSPVGNRADTVNSFKALAPRLRALGWHVQWYARLGDLSTIAELHQGSGVVAVLDHLAGVHAGLPAHHPAWENLQTLAGLGSWLKLSGWYRLQSQAPYQDLDALLSQAATLFGPRIVWGSDWPHTAFAPDALPHYASLLEPIQRTLPAALQQQAFESAAATLYA